MNSKRFSTRSSSIPLTALLCSLAVAGAVAKEGSDFIVDGSGDARFQGLPFRASVDVRQGYDDNVFTTRTNRVGSAYTSVNPMIQYSMGTPRTSLSMNLGMAVTYYWDRPGRDWDYTPSLSLNLNHRFSPRTTLDFDSLVTYRSEPDFGEVFGTDRRSGDYFFTRNSLSLSHEWTPIFSTVTGFDVTGIHYNDSSIGEVDDRFDYTIRQSFRFLVRPTTTLIAEYRAKFTEFQTNPISSLSHYVLGGIDQDFTPRLSFRGRAGAEFREFDSGGSKNSPYVSSLFSYAYGLFSSLEWSTRYGLEAPNVRNLRTRTSFRTGLRWTHGFTPVLSGYINGFYRYSDYDGAAGIPGFTENALDLGTGIRYSLSQHIVLEAGYNFTTISSQVEARDYDRNRYFLGMLYAF